MTDSNAVAERPFFSALLVPHRSLGRTGFLVLMGALAAISFVSGVVFWVIGAWPVVGFFGLDIALVFVAFRLNYRSARAFEEIEVAPHEIVLRKVGPTGRAHEFRFNPRWVRLDVETIPDEGVTHVTLVDRGRGIEVGAFLNPEDRGSFADALKGALVAARAGGLDLA